MEYCKKYEPIDGKWLITKELGSGSFGTVFEIVRKDDPDMKSALKVISIPQSQNEVRSFREENYDMDEQSITSFYHGLVDDCVKEFKLMSQLKGNSNIVSYEDHDVMEKINGDFGWDILIRMELLTPMGQYFAKTTPTRNDVIKLGIDICKALEVCQKYNIIHRDIKPSNIFISDAGGFKLGDFGVARTLEKTTSELSKKGTYTYMAPEVFKGEAYGSNVDIYSLGIVMYKLLNNNLEPFRKDKTYQESEKALTERMSNISVPKPANADGRLAEIVLKACAYNASDRYESPIQMRIELENILYNSSESNIIYPTGDKLAYEKSDNEDDITLSAFSNNEQDEETASIFSDNDSDEGTASMFADYENKSENEYQENKADTNINNVSNVIIEKTSNTAETYKDFWLKYTKFKGCATRREFWTPVLINAIILAVLVVIELFVFPLISPLVDVITLAVFVPTLAITTRRLHDTGHSGHWQWLYFTVYGSIAVLVFLCQKSKYENNKYRVKGEN